MAWRQLHDTVSSSRSLASLSSDAERLFWRILAQTDPWGRMRGEPVKVRVLCVPMLAWDDDLVSRLLSELQTVERVVVYTIANASYLQVLDFDENQKAPTRRRGTSRFPEWNGLLPTTPGDSGSLPTTPADSDSDIDSDRTEVQRPDQEQDQERASSELAVNGHRPLAQTVVAYFVDRSRENGSEPPKRVVGQVAKIVGELVKEGFADERLRAGIDVMLAKRLHPSALPSAVHESALPAAGRNGRPVVTPEQMYQQAIQLQREGR